MLTHRKYFDKRTGQQ